MASVSDFQRADLAAAMVKQLSDYRGDKARFMEFCGSHTMAIMHHGIRQLLPENISLVSGPGCPVCVTDTGEIDRAVALTRQTEAVITSFGDMLRVPGSRSSLQTARAGGADIRMVYSPRDALNMAAGYQEREFIFIGVGFETTAPTVAAAIIEARERSITNFSVLSLHKICPPVVHALLASGEVDLQGMLCPGHVSAVIGSRPWEFIARDFNIPCAVTGFEPLDILHGINLLAEQRTRNEASVEIAYRRGVSEEGNPAAVAIMNKVFEPAAASWRGIGEVAESGLAIRPEFSDWDAAKRYEIDPGPTVHPKGCICGEILRGVKTPSDCGLFRSACRPENPVGPCMVSSEGTCAAYYQYGDAGG